MGAWGVRSYEFDEAADALDAGFARVHGDAYDDLMDDRNPTPFEQVQAKLANEATRAAAIEALRDEFGDDADAWDEVARLALAGVVVRHAELGVAADDDWQRRAVAWLEAEEVEWDEATKRRLRRQKEIDLLKRSVPGPP